MTAAITEATALALVAEALRITAQREPAQLHVLCLIASSAEPPMMTELAKARGKTTASMTGCVDMLEGQGLVMRLRAEDRRVVRVALTDEGRRELRSLVDAVVGLLSAGGES